MLLYKSVPVDQLKIMQDELLSMVPNRQRFRTDLFYLDKEPYLGMTHTRNMMERLGLLEHVMSIATVVVDPVFNNRLPIHIDSGVPEWSFNIPLRNCNGTYTTWYQPKPHARSMSKEGPGHGYDEYDPADCEEIGRLEMTHPHIVNVKVPHTVINPTNKVRILCAIRLAPTFDMEAFGDIPQAS